MKKNQVCVSSKKCFKDNIKTAHWVGHPQLRTLDTDDLFIRKPVVDENQTSVTGNTMKQSDSGKKTRFITRRRRTIS